MDTDKMNTEGCQEGCQEEKAATEKARGCSKSEIRLAVCCAVVVVGLAILWTVEYILYHYGIALNPFG